MNGVKRGRSAEKDRGLITYRIFNRKSLESLKQESPTRDDGSLDWGSSSRIAGCGQVMHIV